MRKALFLLLVSLSSLAWGQGSCVFFPSTLTTGTALSDALSYVCAKGTSANSCVSGVGAIAIYSDESLGPSFSITQPAHADSTGNTNICALPGTYEICTTSPRSSAPYCWNQQFWATTTTAAAAPAVTAKSSSLAFGTVNIGQSVALTDTITAGAIAATITPTLTDTTDYSVSMGTCPNPLPANTSCTITVTFAPQSAATLNGALNLGVTGGTTTAITLTGVGATPPPPASVPTASSATIAPTNPTIPISGTQQFSLTETRSDSSTVTPSAAQVGWNASGAASASPTLVAGGSFCGSPSGGQCTIAVNVTKGDTLVVPVVGGGGSNGSVTDSLGSTFTCKGGGIGGTNGSVICVGVAASTGSDTFTCTMTGAGSGIGCDPMDWSGVTATFDTSLPNGITNSGSGSATATMTAFTTAQTDLVVMSGFQNSSGSWVAGSGLTLVATTSTQSNGTEYKANLAPTVGYAPTFTVPSTSATWYMVAVALNVSASAQVANISTQGVASGTSTGTSTISGNTGYLVQNSTNNSCGSSASGVTSITCPMPLAFTAGDGLAAFVMWHDATATISSITDTGGDTLASQASATGNGLSGAVYFVAQGKGAGSESVTVNFGGGGATAPSVALFEVGGLAATPVDVHLAATAANRNCSPGSPSTAQAAEFALWGCLGTTGTQVTTNGALSLITPPQGAGAAVGDLFASGAQTSPLSLGAGTASVGLVLSLKTVIGSTTLTVSSSTAGGPWTVASQQPATTEYYPGTIFTTPLPSDVGSHLFTNSDAITNNIFGNNGTTGNASISVQSTTTTNGAGSGFANAFCYSSSTDPIYKITGVRNPPPNVANNPLNKYFHLAPGCPFDNATASSDKFFMDWDQSTDLDSTTGGRILAAYDFGAANESISSVCTCATTACADATSACQVGFYFAQYSHPFNDTSGLNEGGGAPGTSALFAPGAGEVREAEIMAGTINHAIMLDAGCLRSSGGNGTADAYVFPAFGNAGGCNFVDANRPLNGNLFYIDSGYNCSTLPAWQKPVCVAMQTYGGYMHDTGGSNGANGGIYIVGIEGGMAHTLAGISDTYFNNWIIANGDTWSCPGGNYPQVCTGTNGAVLVEDSASTSHKVNLPFFNMPGLLSPTNHLHIVDPCIVHRMTNTPGAC